MRQFANKVARRVFVSPEIFANGLLVFVSELCQIADADVFLFHDAGKFFRKEFVMLLFCTNELLNHAVKRNNKTQTSVMRLTDKSMFF